MELNESLFFAKGTTRKCFYHPDNEGLCIKIPMTDQGDRNKGIKKAVLRENKFYKKLQKRNINWQHLSQYKGDIETNLGIGSVYQLIRDDNGHISQSLESYFETNNCYGVKCNHCVKKKCNVISRELNNLHTYMQQNKILTTSLLPRNIVVKKESDAVKLVIIDDIGSSEFIPLSELTAKLTKNKINRKWGGMIKLIKENHSMAPALNI